MYRYIVSIKVRTATQKSSLQLITSNLLISVYIYFRILSPNKMKALRALEEYITWHVMIYLFI